MSIKVNGKLINVTMFPDRTSQVWKLPDELFDHPHVIVNWDFEHEGEFMHLAQLKSLLDWNNITAELHFSYLPYARQDKSVSNTSTFALKSFAELVNHLKFTTVASLDTHSSVAEVLINNFIDIPPINEIKDVIKKVKSSVICFPDQGAYSRYGNRLGLYSTIAKKVRDPLSGKITSFELCIDAVCIKDHSILIVDDICDGGATFTQLATMLYDAGAKEVNLYITHGIFSKGLRPLKDSGILNIYTSKGRAYELKEGGVGYEKI